MLRVKPAPRHRPLRLALLTLTLFAVAGFVGLQDEERVGEPRFQGRPLRYWLAQMSNPAADEARIREAFREMGPQSVPVLLDLARQPDGLWTSVYTRLYELSPAAVRSLLPFPETAGLRRQHCQWGLYLSVLGPRAGTDVRYLVAGLKSPAVRDRLVVVNLLGGLAVRSKPALQGLKQALHDPEVRVRRQAALMWFHADPHSAVAVPQLLETLASPSALLRSDAALALGRVGRDDPRVEPALRKALADPSEYVRTEAAEALARLAHARE